MNKSLKDILISDRTLEDEDQAFLLGLSYAIDVENRFCYYTGDYNNPVTKKLAEEFYNNYSYIDVYGVVMYTDTPLHILKYMNRFDNVNCHVLIYSNGAICIDQVATSNTVHIWIDKETVQTFNIIKEEEYLQIYKQYSS
jgi:hypothetical protein